MAITIIKSKNIANGYYVGGKAILLDNWKFHKAGSNFTTAEIKAFDSYIKSAKL